MQIGIMNDPRREILAEIQLATELGFDFIDLTMTAPNAALETTDWRAVGQAIQATGLGVIGYAAPYLAIDNPSPAIRQAALDELRRSIDAAKIVGAPVLTTRFLGWPAHLSEAAGYEYYRQLYEILIKHGEERGVMVALENSAHNDHQLKWFREIFFRLPELKLLYNMGHGNVWTKQSLTREYLFALADRLVHVHISDNDGTRDARLPLGAPDSGINFRRDFQSLRSFQYDGSITLDIGGDRRWSVESAKIVRELWETVV